jgi:predicted Zn-ribbon and HTH transcriptional regulator
MPHVTKRKVSRAMTVTIWLWACQCERCGYGWEAKGEKPPVACASCKSKYWDTPRGALRRGPKPKATGKASAK